MRIDDVRDILASFASTEQWDVLTSTGVVYSGVVSIYSEEDGYVTLTKNDYTKVFISADHIVAMI